MTGALWVSLILTVGIIGIVIIYPLFFRKDSLYFQKEAALDFDEGLGLLEKLKELETDFKMGKLSESEYQQMEISLKRELLAG